MTDVGDLGRRVAERRRELGLSEEQLAERSGMDPGYLRSLETSASPQPSRTALLHLAVALETTVEGMLGAGTQIPPGQGTGDQSPSALDVLDDEECRALMRPGGVGRVVLVEPRGPVALPVNYKMMGDDVVFRTAANPTLLGAITDGDISFEVDRLDDALAEGWSVLLSGRAAIVDDPDEVEDVRRLGVGERDVYVRMTGRRVTGRRIRRT
jgi:transcriptional regulator with XRE-family HTH domain